MKTVISEMNHLLPERQRSVEEKPGVYTMALDEVEITIVAPDGDLNVVCMAAVADFAGVPDPCMILEDALKAGFLWRGARGATFSIAADSTTLVMTDRRLRRDFEDGSAFLEYLNAFADEVASWRGYVENSRTESVAEPQVRGLEV